MKAIKTIGLLLLAACLNYSCANYKLNLDASSQNWNDQPLPDKKLDFKVYLIGDAGASKMGERSEGLELLRQTLEKATKNSAVVFLGNNAIPDGLPGKKAEKRELAEHQLKAQMDILKDYPGKIIFLPGNYDWAADGVDGLRRQQKFIEEYLGRKDVFLPGGGCSGPAVKELTDKLGLLVIDSEWYMADWDLQPEINENCEIQSRTSFIEEAVGVAKDFADKNLLVVGHHPLYSAGRQSDQFAMRDNIFPYFESHPQRHIPLPVIGTVIIAADRLTASREETSYPVYKDYINGIEDLARSHGNIIYAAGHEHNLQLEQDGDITQIVSGAGSLTGPTKLDKSSLMAYGGGQGFAMVDFYQDGEAWVEFVRAKGENSKSVKIPSEKTDTKPVKGGPIAQAQKMEPAEKGLTPEVFYRQKIKEPLPLAKDKIPKTFEEYKAREDSVAVSILQKGDILDLNDVVWGKLYTDYYFEDIKVPVLDLGKTAGGLKAIKKGGGFQTISIRLENSDKTRLYQIRGLKKSAEKLFYPFNKTFAKDILEYGYTAANPYAAYLLKPMEDAVGIYHTNPALVYVPQQPRLGVFNEFGGKLYHFEERPDDDWSNLYSFGFSKKIVSTGKMLEERMASDKAVIDQPLVLRSRLFDVIIGDWDRHPDQWRWATKPIEGTDKTLYQPIPRDRDQAFANYGGLVFFASRLVVPQFRSTSSYDGKMNKWEAKWLPWQARDVDHFFLNELSWEDWEKQVKYVQEHLTDASIEQGMKWLPSGVYQKMAPELIQNIKSRRDKLMQISRWWYEEINHTVTVVATQKENLIQVNRKSNKETKVTIFEKAKDGEVLQKIYERTFENEVTKEIRIFGLEGDDEFEVEGKAKQSPLVRLIGGVDADEFKDKSKVSGLRRKTIIHDDRMEDNEVKGDSETKDCRQNDYDRNTYFFRENPVDHIVGLPIIGYNPDEALFMGASVNIHRYGFRSENIHQLAGQVAFSTHGYYFRYMGDYQRLLGKQDLVVEASLETPRYVNNFFGLGNDTKKIDNAPNNYYRLQMERYNLYAAIKHQTDGGLLYAFGPMAKAVRVNRQVGSFLDVNEQDVRPEVFDYQYFAGVNAKLEYTNVDKKLNPSRGVDFKSFASWQANVEHPDMNYLNLGGALGLYIPIDRKHHLVFATRVGGSHNFGKFDFFNAPSLGGSQSDHLGGHLTMRGFNSGRFTGRSIFYHNTDLRWRIFSSRTLGMPVSFGVAPAFDYGRVWSDGEQSDTWHYSYGGGIWASPLDYVSFTFSLMKTVEGQRFTAALGYEF